MVPERSIRVVTQAKKRKRKLNFGLFLANGSEEIVGRAARVK